MGADEDQGIMADDIGVNVKNSYQDDLDDLDDIINEEVELQMETAGHIAAVIDQGAGKKMKPKQIKVIQSGDDDDDDEIYDDVGPGTMGTLKVYNPAPISPESEDSDIYDKF